MAEKSHSPHRYELQRKVISYHWPDSLAQTTKPIPSVSLIRIELPKMIAQMNRENLSFVIHVGDFEADPRPYNRAPTKISMPCVAKNFKRVKAVFQTSKHPFVLTPGDNDWTDCSKLKAKKVKPTDALAMVRRMFYPKGKSLGQNPMPVVSQSSDAGFAKFVENLTWSKGGVTFATVHLVGSNNNLGKKPEPKAEFIDRTKANTAWVKKAFAKARADNSLGLVLLTQANPAFEGNWTGRTLGRYFRPIASLGVKQPKKKKAKRHGYDEFRQLLLKELATFKKHTLLMHGDNHLVKMDLLNKEFADLFKVLSLHNSIFLEYNLTFTRHTSFLRITNY